MAYFLQNNFGFGISGDRLLGIRDNEIYTQTAKDLTNFLVSDIGSLRVAKQFTKTSLSLDGEVLDVVDTIFSYYLVLTSTKLHRISKVDNSTIDSADHTYGVAAKISVLSNNKIILYNNGTEYMKTYNLTEDDIQIDTKFLDLDLPIRDLERVVVDMWKIQKNPVTGTGIPVNIATIMISGQDDFKIKVEADGTMKLFNSETVISRFYTSYRASVDGSSFDNPVVGESYAILRVNYKPSPELETGWIVENTKVTIGDLTKDNTYGGDYFSKINGGACEGTLTFGNLVDIRKPDVVAYYQNRVFIHKDSYIYASKVNELKNFRNGINNDDAFFFSPNPINNTSGRVIQMVSDYGLFIISTAGIYTLGYNGVQLTPLNFGGGLVVATNQNVKGKVNLLDGILYFTNEQNIFKALMVDRSSLVLQFNVVTVDRFATKILFDKTTIVSIEDKDYICTRSVDNNYIYLIEYMGEGLFRKVKLEFTTNSTDVFIGFKSNILHGKVLNSYGTKNYKNAVVVTNPPLLTRGGDMYIYDNKSVIRDVVIKMINEDRQAIEGIRILKRPLENRPSNFPDLYSNYRLRDSSKLKLGYEIEILTNENEKAVELLGIQTSIDPIADK